jgi:hypothetical protein
MASFLYAGAQNVAFQGVPKCCQLDLVARMVTTAICSIEKSKYSSYPSVWASEIMHSNALWIRTQSYALLAILKLYQVIINYQCDYEGVYDNCSIPTINMTKMVTSRHGPPDVTITAWAGYSQRMYTWTPCVWSRAHHLIAVLSLVRTAEPPFPIGCTLPPQYETACICRGPQHTPWMVHNNTVSVARNFLSFACDPKVNWVEY